MASLRNIPLPSMDEDKENQVGGWDETIAPSGPLRQHWDRPSVSRHAMAHGTWVCGICQADDDNNNGNEQGTDDARWITWRTDFAPHRVCRVTSNHDGSVVVISTDGGTVSLLRGCDGKVLATRRVTSHAEDQTQRPAEVAFVLGADRFGSKTVLHILAHSGNEDVPTANIILVSNIDGGRLNDKDDMDIVADAARTMSIDALVLEHVPSLDVEALLGCFASANTIRFAAADTDGTISLHDYSLDEKKSRLVKDCIDADGQNTYLTKAGLALQPVGTENYFLVVCACSEKNLEVCWYDVMHTTMACKYTLASENSMQGNRILGIQPLYSFSEESALSVAVSCKTDSQATIKILQAAVEETMGLVVLSTPHLLYEVPLKQSPEALDLAPLDVAQYGAYSFRYRTRYGSDFHDCGQFATGNDPLGGSLIGQVRLLLQSGSYDQADEIVASYRVDLTNKDDLFAKFHSSEVELYRLKSILASTQVGSEESLGQAKECLRCLTAGAVSGSDMALQYLVDAARSVAAWPSQRQGSNAPTLAEYSITLSGMIAALTGALEAAPPARTSGLERAKRDLEKRLSAMKCLESLMTLSDGSVLPQSHLNPPFCKVKSVSDVFCALVTEGCFSMAELLCKSEWRKELSPEVLASAVLELGPSYDPKVYVRLLRSVVIPSLMPGHEAIPLIRSWACRIADAFDEDELTVLSLDSSIFLLETTRGAIQDLNRRMHASFASYSPFVEMRQRKTRVSPRSAMLDTSADSGVGSEISPRNRPVYSKSFGNPNDQPNPTILELSSMRGGAVKSQLGSLSKIRPRGINLDDDDDDNEGRLDVKIRHAIQLRLARQLGLSRRVLTLRNFARAGGADHVARQLVRLYSSTASNHDGRFDSFALKVRPFCEEASTSYDEALVAYTHSLCDSKNASLQAIVESASVARCCSSTPMKCTAALIVLRAALLGGQCPTCVQKLSSDAVKWAEQNPTVKSELQEASRLLVIDEIVVRYCGRGARDLFRVDNPRHSERLLDFVCRHVEGASVVQDALNLCEAFAHLSKKTASALLLQRAIDTAKADFCALMVSELAKVDPLVAVDAGDRAVAYCCAVVDDTANLIRQGHSSPRCKKLKTLYSIVCRAACSIIEAMQSLCHWSSISGENRYHSQCPSAASLFGTFKRLSELHQRYDIFPAISDLQVTDRAVKLLLPLTDRFVSAALDSSSDQDSSYLLSSVRWACSLLVQEKQSGSLSTWCAVLRQVVEKIVWETKDGRCIDILQATGLFREVGSEEAAKTVLSLMLSLCMRASSGANNHLDPLSRMSDVIRVFAIATGRVIAGCPQSITNAAVFIGSMAETAGQVLLRGDSGTGDILEELRSQLTKDAWVGEASDTAKTTQRVRGPILQPSWYVGDGLLLPPDEALSRSVGFCKEMLFNCLSGGVRYMSNMDEALELHRFLRERGAGAVALRVLAISNVTALASSEVFADTHDRSTSENCFSQHWGNLESLAERSLGGSGTGITSETIDSQLAMSYLLALPVKQAFQIYKASLPSAVARRDFTRVHTLSNIGIAAGGGHTFDVGWKKQEVLVSQCKKLSIKAKWWKILKKYRVEFDPSRFEDQSSLPLEHENAVTEGSTTNGSQAYAATLIPSLICNSSRALGKNSSPRFLAGCFAVAFGLDYHLAAQKHVEFLLSSPPEKNTRLEETPESKVYAIKLDTPFSSKDVRFDLLSCERLAKESLSLIASSMKRSAVLRRCVTSLERNQSARYDYERHSLVLTLYHSELSLVVAQDQTIRNLDATPFEDELELIDRRRDALEILSSFFHGEKKDLRPSFTNFFVPLQVPFRAECPQIAPDHCSILGAQAGEFDALQPLQNFVSTCFDSAATAALAPLGVPLGMPSGRVHARFLIERFRNSQAVPSFDDDIIPVLKRLKSPRDRRDLSEWFASRYIDTDDQKLRCVEYALTSAMQLSDEIERRIEKEKCSRRTGVLEALTADEEQALEAVKRLNEMKSTLSDKQEVHRVLRSGVTGASDQVFEVRANIDALTRRLQDNFWSSEDPSPEKFVEALLMEASMLAANESMRSDRTFSVHHFRNMASTVHQACKEISDQYSHVHIGQICRDVVRRWLVHGDEVSASMKLATLSKAIEPVGPKNTVVSLSSIEEADDTLNFVMDLNKPGEGKSVWSDDVGSSSISEKVKPERVSMEEEPFALVVNGSARELSEHTASRVALRVAFVMSFAEGYHSEKDDSLPNDENRRINTKAGQSSSARTKPRLGLLTRMTGEGARRKATVLEHARELLRLVFVKVPGSDSLLHSSNATSVSFMMDSDESAQSRKSLTFAMRYRALRAVSILCPQEALEHVVQEEGYLSNSNGERICTLQQCAYGSFLAKEIEEMGLPLPHSDLIMLCTMHFPSYARALWRHHRDRANGRLLLLLLEMSLRADPDSKCSLTVTLLDEMTRLQLPRTMLCACECIARAKNARDAHGSTGSRLLEECPKSVLSSLRAVGTVILSEIHALTAKTKDSTRPAQDLAESVPTLRRLGKLVETFSDIQGGADHVAQFIDVLLGLLDVATDDKEFAISIAEVAAGACSCLPDAMERSQYLGNLKSYPSGRFVLANDSATSCHAPIDCGTVSAVLRVREESYHAPFVAL